MSSIPIDILRHILEHVDKAGLSKMCLLNKICCFYSQDVLYRHIQIDVFYMCSVCQTLAQSTDLAKRVRSFEITTSLYNDLELRRSLQNMIYLRSLSIFGEARITSGIFDGCTFELVSFTGGCYEPRTLLQFLYSQKSLTKLTLLDIRMDDFPELRATFLPKLTRVATEFPLLRKLIPNRSVGDVISYGYVDDEDSVDLSFFTLSNAPILKLTINYTYLYPKPGNFLASIFPSLTHLEIVTTDQNLHTVRESSFIIIV
jgi:hypothetical protein